MSSRAWRIGWVAATVVSLALIAASIAVAAHELAIVTAPV